MEHLAPAQAVARVHSKQPGGGASSLRFTNDPGGVAGEVFLPSVAAGMEQRRHFAGVGIDAAEVGAFLVIGFRAGERQVRRVIRPAVLAGDDVLDVEAKGGGVLRETAIFAAVPGPLAHEFAGGAVHSGRLGVGDSQFATFLGSFVLLDFCQIFFKVYFVRKSRSEIRLDSSPFASVRQALFRRQTAFLNMCYGWPGPGLHQWGESARPENESSLNDQYGWRSFHAD